MYLSTFPHVHLHIYSYIYTSASLNCYISKYTCTYPSFSGLTNKQNATIGDHQNQVERPRGQQILTSMPFTMEVDTPEGEHILLLRKQGLETLSILVLVPKAVVMKYLDPLGAVPNAACLWHFLYKSRPLYILSKPRGSSARNRMSLDPWGSK